MGERNYSIDLAKGLGIFLVILGHHYHILTWYIYSFHMPLFFLLSGMFHSTKLNNKSFLQKKYKQLIIPYLGFSIIGLLYFVLVRRNFGNQDAPIWQYIIGIIYGTEIENFSSLLIIPLWFLPCLFIVSNLYHFIFINSRRVISANLLCIIIGFFLAKYLPFRLPWSLGTAFMAMPFYSIGHLFRNKIISINVNIKNTLICLTLVILSILSYNMNGIIDMLTNQYNNIVLFYISGLSGSLYVIYLMKLIPTNKFRFLNFIGKHTLILLALHGFTLLPIILLFKMGGYSNLPEGNLYLSLIYTILQIIICIPFIIIINKHLPFLIGKGKK